MLKYLLGKKHSGNLLVHIHNMNSLGLFVVFNITVRKQNGNYKYVYKYFDTI